MFALTATPVALSAGELDESVGAATTTTVKLNVVVYPGEGITTCIVNRSCINLHVVTLKSQGLTMGSTLTALPKKVAALAILKD